MAGETILLVDPAPVELKFMRLLLTHEGYQVRTAERAEDALALMSSFRPELVLADLRLPGMNGLEMTRRIRQNPHTRDIKVVALTTPSAGDEQEQAMGAGCDGYLTKPLDTEVLSFQVRAVLERPAPLRVPCLSAPAAPEDTYAPGISNSEMDHLRDSFLSEGVERTRQLLDTLDHQFDAAAASRHLHNWAGTGGLLGFPEITRLARTGEEMLRGGSFRSSSFRESLSALAFEFASLREANRVAIPEHVANALQGRRMALIGFSPDRADFLCGALEHVHARPWLFDLAGAPHFESIGACDLALVHVRPETLGSSWLDPATAIPTATTLVLCGDRRDLLNLPPAVQARDVEFLVDTWHPEEVLMRLSVAVSRPPKSSPVHAPVAAATPVPIEAPAPAEPPRAQAAASRPTVVIADDDRLIVTVVGSTLQNYGMTCHAASNGEDALRIIREEKPQVAVLDVNMPGLDGYDVLAAVRAEKLPVQVVLLTARQREEDILRGFQLGADDYLVKPFNPLELVARMKRLIRR